MNTQQMDAEGRWYFSFSSDKGKTFNTYVGGLSCADVKIQTDHVWNDDAGRPEGEGKNWDSRWNEIVITRGRSVWQWQYVTNDTPA